MAEFVQSVKVGRGGFGLGDLGYYLVRAFLEM
jgi:hypothetical protein